MLLPVAVISLSLHFLMLSLHIHYLQCWQILYFLRFLTTYSLSTSSLGCKASCIVINFLVLLSICLSTSLVYFMNGPEYLTMNNSGVHLFDKIFTAELGLQKFSRFFEILFSYFFFHHHLFDGVRFQYSQVLVVFLFSKRSDTFLISLLYTFCYVSFFTLHYGQDTFSMPNSIPIS